MATVNAENLGHEIAVLAFRVTVGVLLIGNGGNMMYRAWEDSLRPHGELVPRGGRVPCPGWDFGVGVWLFVFGMGWAVGKQGN
jgi:uncharacterized membrane protein YfcA